MSDTVVTVVGNVATGVEFRESATGGVARFRFAVTGRRWDRQEESWADGPTSFYTVWAWRTLGANLAASVSVGEPLVVHGRIEGAGRGTGRPAADVRGHRRGGGGSRSDARDVGVQACGQGDSLLDGASQLRDPGPGGRAANGSGGAGAAGPGGTGAVARARGGPGGAGGACRCGGGRGRGGRGVGGRVLRGGCEDLSIRAVVFHGYVDHSITIPIRNGCLVA